MKIFLGWDSREPIGFAVFCHSLLRRASIPVEIVPLVQPALRTAGLYTRERGPTEATEFSMTRFLIPHLCNYEGHAIFLDGADMLCRADIAELQDLIAQQRRNAVLVVQHDYVPHTIHKMDGQPQTVYARKNWSSAVCFNNTQCTMLTPDYVNTASGLDLHRFHWLGDEQIGALPLEWNYIVGADHQATVPPKIVHFSDGGPWFRDYETCAYADEWRAEYNSLRKPYERGFGREAWYSYAEGALR